MAAISNCRCGKGDLAPLTQYVEKVADKPFVPSREYLIALGFLSYIGAVTSKNNITMLESILKEEGYRG